MGFGWFDGDIVFGQLFRALNPAVDVFHLGVGHRNFIVVVVGNVMHFGMSASPCHSQGTRTHHFPAGKQYAIPLVLQ